MIWIGTPAATIDTPLEHLSAWHRKIVTASKSSRSRSAELVTHRARGRSPQRPHARGLRRSRDGLRSGDFDPVASRIIAVSKPFLVQDWGMSGCAGGASMDTKAVPSLMHGNWRMTWSLVDAMSSGREVGAVAVWGRQ